MSDRFDANERTDPAEHADPIENAEHADPIEPIESTEPTEPIESIEPSLAIERIDPDDRIDQRDGVAHSRRRSARAGVYARVACFLMRPGGFEPPTRGLEVRRSVH